MLVNFVNIWIRVIQVQDLDAKMEVFVKWITHLRCHHSDADVLSDSRRHCVKSQNATLVIQDHAKTVDRVNWKHSKITFVIALKDIPVGFNSISSKFYLC